MYAGIPGRRYHPGYPPRRRRGAEGRHRRGADCGTVGACATGPLPVRSPTDPAPTSSSTVTDGFSTSGKAKSLRSRLSNYFADPATLPARTAQMVAAADRVEWIQVANEVEAILLEYALIKEHRPRFNIRLVDDKSYPWLAVTLPDTWPRAAVVRGRRRPGIRYFGPYAHVGALRDTLDLLLRTFPIRSCSDAKLERHVKLGRPCLMYHIERCSGPCIGAVDHEEYDGLVEDVMSFFAGDTDEVERRSTRRARRGGRRTRLRMRGAPARSVGHLAHGRRAPTDRHRAARGPRRRRHRRRTARSGRLCLPRPSGPHRGATGVHRRQGGGPDPRPTGGPCPGTALRRRRASGGTPRPPPPSGARHRRQRMDVGSGGGHVGDRRRHRSRRSPTGPRSRTPRGHRRLRRLPGQSARGTGGPARPPAGGQAQPHGDGGPQRRRGARAPPAATRLGLRQPRPGPRSSPGGARSSPMLLCASSVTT